jgi:hypothetical protein
MTTIETLAHLLKYDLYALKEWPDGRTYYEPFDLGEHAVRIRRERDQLHARVLHVAQARIEALEEAARVCESLRPVSREEATWDALDRKALECAAHIRALKSQEADR